MAPGEPRRPARPSRRTIPVGSASNAWSAPVRMLQPDPDVFGPRWEMPMTRVLGLTLLAFVLTTAPAPAQFSASTARRSAVWVLVPIGAGSGVLLDRQRGLVVTAAHVVRGSSTVRVVFPQYRDGKLVLDPQWYR